MSDVALDRHLERRCRRLVRAYPSGTRAEEVLTTLMESNEGRRRPRAADAWNVLWHGLATRLRDRSAGTRFGAWGDAAAVTVVTFLLMQASVAAALAYRVYSPTGNENYTEWDPVEQSHTTYLDFHDRRLWMVAVVAAGLAVLTALAACLGRVRLTRVLVVATAAAGLGTVVFARVSGTEGAFRTPWSGLVALLSVAAMLAVLLTTAVRRAARVVPTWWWGTAAIVGAIVAMAAVDIGRGPFGSSRMGVALVAYAEQSAALMLFALPLVREYRDVFRGLVPLAAAATPFGVAATSDAPRPRLLVLVVVAVWAGLAAVVAVVSRLPRSVPREAES